MWRAIDPTRIPFPNPENPMNKLHRIALTFVAMAAALAAAPAMA